MVRWLTFALAVPAWLAGMALAAGRDGALETLNRWRADAGIQPLESMDASASEGCRLHDVYLAKTGEFGHAEDPASPFYTPLGAAAGNASLLADGPDALGRWLAAPYHRVALLEPRLRISGYAEVGDFACLRVLGGHDDSAAARPAALTLYPWPPEAERDVPVAGPERGLEIPDPYDDLPGGVTRAGYLLTVNLDGPWEHTEASAVQLTAISLTPDRGAPVAVSGLDVGGGFGLFPQRTLSRATWYTARAAGVVGNVGRAYPFSLRWRFQTLRFDPALSVDGEVERVAVDSRNPARVRLRLSQAGRVVLDRPLAPGSRPRVAPGSYVACASQRGGERYRDARRCDEVEVAAE